MGTASVLYRFALRRFRPQVVPWHGAGFIRLFFFHPSVALVPRFQRKRNIMCLLIGVLCSTAGFPVCNCGILRYGLRVSARSDYTDRKSSSSSWYNRNTLTLGLLHRPVMATPGEKGDGPVSRVDDSLEYQSLDESSQKW